MKFFDNIFKKKPKPQLETKPTEIKLVDPLDPIVPLTGGFDTTAFDSLLSNIPQPAVGQLTETKMVGDAEGVTNANIGDSAESLKCAVSPYSFPVSPGLQGWYAQQSFIGYQACAIMAQHWLVSKACSVAGEDAVRQGYEVTVDDGTEITSEMFDTISKRDREFKLDEHCIDLAYFTNVFGVRVTLFEVDSDDPKYYELPFNPDGVAPGSYKGMKQIDPYWMTPVLGMHNTSDPTSQRFYDPEYWIIGGVKYHHSHLVVTRGEKVADILKPMYQYGGIPLTQRIYERIYAAERIANEAPLLALSKRTTSLHVDLKKVTQNQAGFEARLQQWVNYRDNHGVKVLGLDETMEQFDISLSDMDSVIANQYELVAAIAKVPATKLMSTSPKGFNATGEFELKNYYQELESIQSKWLSPLVNRHHLLVFLNEGWKGMEPEVSWKPVDNLSADALAALNKLKSDIGIQLINAGVISPDEERNRIRNDDKSGYTGIDDEPAEEDFGMSPENIAELTKAKADIIQGEGSETNSFNSPEQPSEEPGGDPAIEEGVDLDPTEERLYNALKSVLSNKSKGKSVGLSKLESLIVSGIQSALKAAEESEKKVDGTVGEGDVEGSDEAVGVSPSVKKSWAGSTKRIISPAIKLKGSED